MTAHVVRDAFDVSVTKNRTKNELSAEVYFLKMSTSFEKQSSHGKMISTKESSQLQYCAFCSSTNDLRVCARCKEVSYCSRIHQNADWKQHKKTCHKTESSTSSPLTVESTEQSNIRYSTAMQELSTTFDVLWKEKKLSSTTIETPEISALQTPQTTKPSKKRKNVHFSTDTRVYSADELQPIATQQSPGASIDMDKFQLMSTYMVKCMSTLGICVIDNFLGSKGHPIVEEVLEIAKEGSMQDGQLVSQSATVGSKRIRGDKITWKDGSDPETVNIGYLIDCMDTLIKMSNGKLANLNVQEKTKAMVSCYPGGSTHYIRHIDNPNGDGRCITCIYYLNYNWDVTKDGGLLRMYPTGKKEMAQIEPIFDRLLFFWSDKRNPHEVLPALRKRYAITVWYIDADERRLYLERQAQEASSAMDTASAEY